MKRFNSRDQKVLIIAALIQLTTSFIGSMIPVALPLISNELNLTIESANLISIFYMIALIAVSIPLSKVISQYGVKKCTMYALIVSSIGLLMSALSIDIYFLLLSRVIQGISVAVLLISIYMLVVNQISEENVGSALGIVGSCGYIGMTSAPTISGFIVYYLSWRLMFIIIFLVFVIETILLSRLDSEWMDEKKPMDIMGSALYITVMVLFILGLNYITTWGIYPLIASIILFIVYMRHEKKTTYPIYDLKLLKDLKYVIGNYAAFIAYFITFIATYILNFHLQYVMGFDSRITGVILLTTPLVMVLISPVAGKLSDRLDARILAGAAMTILLFVMIALCFVDLLPIYVLIVVMVVQGIGHGLFSPPNNKFVLTSIDHDDLGDASSMLTTSKEVGKTVSLALYNVICVLLIGNQAIDGGSDIPALISSGHAIMNIAAILTLSAAILLFYSKFHYKD